MTLQQLHYAIVISETGSMNKAAERLYIAQPSLTGAMQELERELGITIFHRSGRGVTLTNDGQEFIDYARQVYHQYETLAEKYAHPNELKKKFDVKDDDATGRFDSLIREWTASQMEEYLTTGTYPHSATATTAKPSEDVEAPVRRTNSGY